MVLDWQKNAEKVEKTYDITIWFLIDNLSIDHQMPIEDKSTEEQESNKHYTNKRVQ